MLLLPLPSTEWFIQGGPMIQITPHMRIFVCVKPLDFRKGIDGTAAVCRNQLLENPIEGALFLFRNRSLTSIRILAYDSQGFWLCTKRLSQGKFQWWPEQSSSTILMNAWELQTLIWNGNPTHAKFGDSWQKIAV
jgi:transposase